MLGVNNRERNILFNELAGFSNNLGIQFSCDQNQCPLNCSAAVIDATRCSRGGLAMSDRAVDCQGLRCGVESPASPGLSAPLLSTFQRWGFLWFGIGTQRFPGQFRWVLPRCVVDSPKRQESPSLLGIACFREYASLNQFESGFIDEPPKLNYTFAGKVRN